MTFHTDEQSEWQWLKLFLATVKGRQKAFWLSTWREDLPYVSHVDEAITVEADVPAWFPRQRQYIHVQEADGSDVYCKINSITDNGDGTYALTTDAAPFTEPVAVSWLELCRMTNEEISVSFNDDGFAMQTVATVVQQ